MAAKRHKKCNNQQKISCLNGQEMGCDKSMMEGAGGAQFDRFGGNWVGRGGGNLGKIDQIVKLFYFLANLQNEIKSFDPSFNDPITEMLPGGFCLNRKIRAAGPGERLHHCCVLFNWVR
jgi:hypothetical protein